jgi:RimJ/RimL family protein N-acetyltransferase
MTGGEGNIDLSALSFSKLPLRYGTDACYITLNESHYTSETVRLRNNHALGKYINYVELTTESHEHWLTGQIKRSDALNFVLVAKHRFSGTLSLYNIEHGKCCEFGRMMMPDDGRRIYALAAEMLGMSFAFEIMGIKTLYCVVMDGNDSVLNFHLRNGWNIDSRYGRIENVNGTDKKLIGLSVDRSKWPLCFEKMRPLAKRLFTQFALAINNK